MEDLALPEGKNVFKISEAAEYLGVKPHVLRYWETEFAEARPRKSYTGQRVYHREDIERIKGIRDLLYKAKYSIEGARQVLKVRNEDEAPSGTPAAPPHIAKGVAKLMSDHHRSLCKLVSQLEKLKTKVLGYKPL